MVGFDLWYPKRPTTKFVVRNITERKRVRIFQYPIMPGQERDLLDIPSVTEADIKASLLKGALKTKIDHQEIIVVESNLDLIQFDPIARDQLEAAGITIGLDAGSGSSFPEAQHKVLHHLVHLAEIGGPFDGGFGSNLYCEILPAASITPTSKIWYTDNTKARKIVEKQVVYNPNLTPATIVWIVYDLDGVTPLATSIDTMTYSGVFELSRVRTFA